MDDLFAKLLEGLLVAKAIVGQEVVVVLVLLEVDRHAAHTELVHDLAVALAVAHGDGLVDSTSHDGGSAVVGVHDGVMLDRGGQREEHLAASLDGRSQPDIDAEAPLEVLHHSVMPALRLSSAGAGEEVGVLEAAHLEGIVLGVVASLESIENHVALSAQNEADVCRVLLDAQNLGLKLGTEVVPTEAELEAVVDIADELATGNVDVAGDGLQREDAVTGLNAVGLLVDSEAPCDLGRLGGRVNASCLDDFLGGDAADLSSLLGGHGLHALSELVEAIAPLLDEVVIVEILGDDDVEHSHTESSVGAGTQTQVPVGTGGNPVDARVDAHELGAAAHHVDGSVAEQTVAVGGQGLLAPEHDQLRQGEHRIVVTTGQTACIVHLGIGGAENVGGASTARDVAGVAGLGVAVVRGTEARMGVCRKHRTTLAAGAAHDEDGLSAVVLLVVGDLLGDGIVSLVPSDALPLVQTAVLAGTLHRIQNTIRVIDIVTNGKAADAETTVGDRMVLVALDLDELAVSIDVGLNAAASGMAARRRPSTTAGDSQTIFFEAPRLAEVGSALSFENLHAFSSSCFQTIASPQSRGLDPLSCNHKSCVRQCAFPTGQEPWAWAA